MNESTAVGLKNSVIPAARIRTPYEYRDQEAFPRQRKKLHVKLLIDWFFGGLNPIPWRIKSTDKMAHLSLDLL